MQASLEFFFWLIVLLLYVLGIIALFAAIPLYILSSIGLMRIAKREALPYPWISFIPLLNLYVLGVLGFKRKIVGIIIPVLVVLDVFCESFIYPRAVNLFQVTFFTKPFFLGGYIALIFISSVLLFRRYSTKWILMTFFSVLSFGFLIPVFLFVIRNNKQINLLGV